MATEDGKRGIFLPIAVTIVGLAAIGVGEDLPIRHSVEHKLTTKSTDALTKAGIPVEGVSFTGRDGTVRLLSAGDRDRATTIVRHIDGVRVVHVIVTTATGVPISPPVTASPTPTVSLTVEPSSPASAQPSVSPVPPPTGAGSPAPTVSGTPTPSPAPATGSPTAAPTPTATAPATPTTPAPPTTPAGPTLAQIQAQVAAVGDVTFAYGTSKLSPTAMARLVRIAAILKATPGVRIRVQGDTDSVGPAAYNLMVSRLRAASVAKQLTALGIPSSRLVIVGYGETKPLVPNDTPAHRAMNRRVDFQAIE